MNIEALATVIMGTANDKQQKAKDTATLYKAGYRTAEIRENAVDASFSVAFVKDQEESDDVAYVSAQFARQLREVVMDGNCSNKQDAMRVLNAAIN